MLTNTCLFMIVSHSIRVYFKSNMVLFLKLTFNYTREESVRKAQLCSFICRMRSAAGNTC